MFQTRFIVFVSCLVSIFTQAPLTLACSSRSIPKPRPSSIASPSTTRAPVSTTVRTTTSTTTTTTTTPRPNITFPTFKCPANYDAWYCLNEATCFTVKIGESIMYNCECAFGFMGPRCEYKELDGSYQPKRPRPILEKASIASGATCILLFLLFVCLTLYLRYDQKSLKLAYEDEYSSSQHCRLCSDKPCCSFDDLHGTKILRNSTKAGNVSWFKYHIEAFPIGLTNKHSQ